MTEPIRRDTLVDAVVERLRGEVLAERYPPGTLLPPERELAASYGVTRTSLKHALVRLVQAGLLETRHGVGTRVRDYARHAGPDLLPVLVAHAGPDWLGEVFEVRREIGALVAARAAAGRPDTGELHELLETVRTARTPDEAQAAECEVHRVLAAATGNRVYGLLVNSLLNAYLEVRHLFRAPFEVPQEAARRLAPLVEAVCDGDQARARTEAERYLAETERLMLG
jgi:GntR family transcriptional regulator, transcriptional repressor for pyruvate dehydrogenase complex